MILITVLILTSYCVKSVQIRSFLWSVFFRIRTEYSVRMRENTDQKKLRIWTLFTQCLFQAIMHFVIKFAEQ